MARQQTSGRATREGGKVEEDMASTTGTDICMVVVVVVVVTMAESEAIYCSKYVVIII